MNKKIFLFPLFCLLLFATHGQNITFDHTYGFSDYSYGKSILQLPDADYVIVANISPAEGNAQLLFARLNPQGEPLYYRQTNNDDKLYNAKQIIQCHNGDFAVTGFVKETGTSYRPFILRTDTNFNTLWEQTLPFNDWTFSQNIVELPDGNFMSTGFTYNADSLKIDALAMKFSADGTLLFSRSSHRAGNDAYTSLSLFNDTLLLLSGYQQENVNGDTVPFFAFMNFEGNETARFPYGEQHSSAIATQAIQDSKGNIVTIGYTYQYDTTHHADFFMTVFDTAGHFVNELFVDHTIWSGADNVYQSVCLGSDGHLFIGGTVAGNSYLRPIILIHHLDADYNFVNSTTRGGSHYRSNELAEIIGTLDGGAILIGSSAEFSRNLSNILICKLDENLFNIGEVNHFLPIRNYDAPSVDFTLFPTPTDASITLQFQEIPADHTHAVLYDMAMKEVAHYSLAPSLSANINVKHLPSGTYLLKVQNNRGHKMQKIIIRH